MTEQKIKPHNDLSRFLSEDYCCGCDSFGNTRKLEYGTVWCDACWDHVTPVPSNLRRAIEQALA